MKRVSLISAAAIAAALLAGCADYEGGYYHSGGGVSMAVGYDGFYDDYYGPFYDGYWAPNGYFYYSTGPNHRFRRDMGHHFRHDSGAGFHEFHGHMRGDGGRR